MAEEHRDPGYDPDASTGTEPRSSNVSVSGSTFAGNVAIGNQGPVTQYAARQAASEERTDPLAGELTVGVLIALDEEFGYYNTVLGKGSVVRLGRSGAANHVKRLEWPGARPVSLVSRVIGRKGAEHASAAAAELLSDCSPGLLVCVGLSGAVTAELDLGDIVIGDTTTGYLANTKILDGPAPGHYEFRPAGDPYRADKWLCDRAVGLVVEAPGIYQQWRQGAVALRRRAAPPLDAAKVKVVRGNLAAGPWVVSSDAFKQWMLRHKRDYQAVDMESSAIATVVWSNARASVRLLMIRAISDAADKNKAQLERDTGARVREVAMKCAALYLSAVLHHVAAN
jgi:nucleoside phosphorylase